MGALYPRLICPPLHPARVNNPVLKVLFNGKIIMTRFIIEEIEHPHA